MSESERYQTWVEDHANCIEDFNKLKADLAAAVEIKEAEKKILLKEIEAHSLTKERIAALEVTWARQMDCPKCNESTSGDCGAHGPRIIRLGPHIPQEAIEGCPLCAEKDADLARLRARDEAARELAKYSKEGSEGRDGGEGEAMNRANAERGRQQHEAALRQALTEADQAYSQRIATLERDLAAARERIAVLTDTLDAYKRVTDALTAPDSGVAEKGELSC